MRTNADNRAAWAWFIIALAASLGANVATAGLLDLGDRHLDRMLRRQRPTVGDRAR